MSNNIAMIPVVSLKHHPENPRKDLGDLTELPCVIKQLLDGTHECYLQDASGETA